MNRRRAHFFQTAEDRASAFAFPVKTISSKSSVLSGKLPSAARRIRPGSTKQRLFNPKGYRKPKFVDPFSSLYSIFKDRFTQTGRLFRSRTHKKRLSNSESRRRTSVRRIFRSVIFSKKLFPAEFIFFPQNSFKNFVV
jgi:hypothetical protein